MAASPHLTRLTALDLKNNGISDAGAAALAASPCLNRLMDLWLGSNQFGEEGDAQLRQRYGSAYQL